MKCGHEDNWKKKQAVSAKGIDSPAQPQMWSADLHTLHREYSG